MDTGIVAAVIQGAAAVTAAAVAGIAARRAGQARRVGNSNAEKIEEVRRQTDGRLDERIQQAVRSVAAEHPGMISNAVATEAVRDLLDAFVTASLRDDDDPTPRRHRRRDDD